MAYETTFERQTVRAVWTGELADFGVTVVDHPR